MRTQTRPGKGASGNLVTSILHFGRLLRTAGLPVGTGRILEAVRAVRTVGIAKRTDFYWALHAVFVNRPDQREVFEQAFHVFWRNRQILERMQSLHLASPESEAVVGAELSRRVAEALFTESEDRLSAPQEPPEREWDAALSWSDRDVLHHRDFEQMSAAEVAQAKAAIARMQLPAAELPTRRFRPGPKGRRVDMRATLRAALRAGGDHVSLVRSCRRHRKPPLIILCDISGSMSQYSRLLLHFAYSVSNHRDRVFTFVFGSRLTNITRHLRAREPDEAMTRISGIVEDWSGGTRIGHCLHEFNRYWSRRVLNQGATVLLITDGLDREVARGLKREMERLHKSCRRLIWLNPLLRYRGFEPKAQGVQAMLPHVDEFRPTHNLQSLTGLVQALNRPGPRRPEGVMRFPRVA